MSIILSEKNICRPALALALFFNQLLISVVSENEATRQIKSSLDILLFLQLFLVLLMNAYFDSIVL